MKVTSSEGTPFNTINIYVRILSQSSTPSVAEIWSNLLGDTGTHLLSSPKIAYLLSKIGAVWYSLKSALPQAGMLQVWESSVKFPTFKIAIFN